MKVHKEITLAVVIGLILALAIAGGIYRARTAIQNYKPKGEPSNTSSNSPNAADNISNSSLYLELESLDNTVTNTPTYKVSGKTLPGTFIAITSDKNDYLIVPNDLGSFSQEVGLIKGANTLGITVYTKDGVKVEKKLSVVYTTVDL